MTTNIAEVLKLAAKPIEYDNDERTWLEFCFKLENYLVCFCRRRSQGGSLQLKESAEVDKKEPGECLHTKRSCSVNTGHSGHWDIGLRLSLNRTKDKAASGYSVRSRRTTIRPMYL